MTKDERDAQVVEAWREGQAVRDIAARHVPVDQAERDSRMVAAYASGDTFDTIAQREGLGRETVRKRVQAVAPDIVRPRGVPAGRVQGSRPGTILSGAESYRRRKECDLSWRDIGQDMGISEDSARRAARLYALEKGERWPLAMPGRRLGLKEWREAYRLYASGEMTGPDLDAELGIGKGMGLKCARRAADEEGWPWPPDPSSSVQPFPGLGIR